MKRKVYLGKEPAGLTTWQMVLFLKAEVGMSEKKIVTAVVEQMSDQQKFNVWKSEVGNKYVIGDEKDYYRGFKEFLSEGLKKKTMTRMKEFPPPLAHGIMKLFIREWAMWTPKEAG